METFRKPYWILLLNTAPVLLLLALCAGEFSVIHTLLPAGSLRQWQVFGLTLGGLGLGAGIYAAVRMARRQPTGILYSLLVMPAVSLWLCWLTVNSSALIPGDVPAWMVPTDPVLMAWTFLMPTLAHALLALVMRFTPAHQPHRALLNFGLAVGVPVAWAVVFGVLDTLLGWIPLPHWGWLEGMSRIGLAVALVISTWSFFFFLVRAIYILSLGKADFWVRGGWVWKVLITLVLPLVGLGINDGWIMGNKFAGHGHGGIFGDFSSPWFIVLTVVNCALLCLPDSPRPALRLALLLGRSVLFGYTCYFFLVFLPFLPLSIPAIIIIGVGFLILAPTLLFVLHVRQLGADVAALQPVYRKPLVLGVLLLGLATLPLLVTADYWHRRQVLHEALAYVYTPDYARTGARLDAAALRQTLDVVRQHKDQRRDFLSGRQQPYLSLYFNWLVLDNLMLSESKIAQLDQVFTAAVPLAAGRAAGWQPQPAAAPQLRALSASSTYDARQQAWVSWVSLEITNPNPGIANGEYSTRFRLPAGCWVGDYYLTIGNREEQGILSEKKTAAWVFAQIVNERSNRDPGLFAYVGPDEVELRVFPVVGMAPRRTRFQLLHKEPCVLAIDGRTLALGRAAAPLAVPVTAPGQEVVYLSATAKGQLPLVARRPYYHFLLDASAGAATRLPAYQARIDRQLAQALPGGVAARFSLVDAYLRPVPAGSSWVSAWQQGPHEGGFYLDGAIRRVLFAAQEHPGPTYPVLVVVTDKWEQAVLDADFADFSSAYPESDIFYVLLPDGRLEAHSLRQSARAALAAAPAPGVSRPVRAWPATGRPRAYLPDNDLADIVLQRSPAVPAAPAESRWLTGLLLRGYSQWQVFHPEVTERERVPFIQASFRAGIMTPSTAFLALENEAQKAALRRKQEQVLSANAALDLDEGDSSPADVPIDGATGLLLLVGAGLAAWQLRRARL